MDRVIFRYFPGKSPVHRFDPRLKLPCFAFLCFSLIRSGNTGLLIMTCIAIASVLVSRLPVKILAADFLRFLPLVILLFTAVYFSEPSSDLFFAFTTAWRFVLVILTGNLFIQTTSMESIRSAVYWYLRPFPLLRAGRIATMIGLTISLIPLFFEEIEESKHALAARGLSPRRSPFRWITSLVFPMLRRIFLKNDERAQAMEARCYNDKKVSSAGRPGPADWIFFGIILAISISALYL